MIYEGDIRETLEECDREYDIIYVDPPWSYNYGDQHSSGGGGFSAARDKYPTMTNDEIKDLPVQQIANQNSLCYLWTAGPQIHKVEDILNAWGFFRMGQTTTDNWALHSQPNRVCCCW